MHELLLGIDVGSTTVKAVVVESATGEIVWRRYERHNTKQSETVLRFLKAIEESIPGFDADATLTAVQAVLQNITYENVSGDPSPATRTARRIVRALSSPPPRARRASITSSLVRSMRLR